MGDRGYSSHRFRDHIWNMSARPAVPSKRNEAPMACPDWIDNNRIAFQAYVDRILVPELAPGDIVIMDNLPSHKGSAVQAAIEAAGARLLYLPSYSPDFNPIEMAFSKLKALLRKAAKRTVEEMWSAIGRLVDAVSPTEAANFFAATGYEPD